MSLSNSQASPSPARNAARDSAPFCIRTGRSVVEKSRAKTAQPQEFRPQFAKNQYRVLTQWFYPGIARVSKEKANVQACARNLGDVGNHARGYRRSRRRERPKPSEPGCENDPLSGDCWIYYCNAAVLFGEQTHKLAQSRSGAITEPGNLEADLPPAVPA